MPLPPTTDTPEQFAHRLTLRIAIGCACVYSLTFALCLASMAAAPAAGVSLFTAFWAGPFLGGALTVTHYSRPRPTTVANLAIKDFKPSTPARAA